MSNLSLYAPEPEVLDAAPAAVASVLVVDDSSMDRLFAGTVVEQRPEWRVRYAENGLEALAALAEGRFDAVLTDLMMPEMDGLELVTEIRARCPLVPVILMTGHGSEEVALQALQRGASSYVPKKNLMRELPPTLERVLAAARGERRERRVLDSVAHLETHFILDNDPTLIPPLIALVQENLAGMRLGDATDQIRVGVALEEAMLNGIFHGNLEVGAAAWASDAELLPLLEARQGQPPYAARRLQVNVKLTRTEGIFIVRDDGPGFDVAALPDPADPAHLGESSRRGLRLIRMFMDEVLFNKAGNQITMIKRQNGPAEG